MKLENLQQYIYTNHLLDKVKECAGIYCIIMDDIPIYVGQSINVYQRLSSHIYNIENASFANVEKKYKFIKAAKMCGNKIRFQVLKYCEYEELDKLERIAISQIEPILNTNQYDYEGNFYRKKLPTNMQQFIIELNNSSYILQSKSILSNKEINIDIVFSNCVESRINFF